MGTALNGKTVFVTGGTGFVGSHLVESLLKQNIRVVSTYRTIDKSSYFFTQDLDKKTIMVNVDVNNFHEVFDVITRFDVDFVFHLAAQALVEPAYLNPVEAISTNIMGTVNVLESARLLPRIQGVVVASSDKAYGKLKDGKYSETDALRGDHPYEVSKSAADLICNAYFKSYGTPVVITRFGNIYGEGDLHFSRIIPGIMESLVTKRKLKLRSDGTFVRDYLHVKDVAEGYILLANNIKKTRGEAYNFGSNDSYSVMNLIKVVESDLNMKVDYEVANTAKNEIPYQSLNSTKIRGIGWKQQYSVRNTATEILNWYKSYFEND